MHYKIKFSEEALADAETAFETIGKSLSTFQFLLGYLGKIQFAGLNLRHTTISIWKMGSTEDVKSSVFHMYLFMK